MSSEPVYLKPNAVLEPLIHRWYAWSYLVPPQSAAMFASSAQLPLLRSFVEAPEVHVSALSNPAMRGGPFIDLPANRAAEAKALLERNERDQRPLAELGEAILTLDKLLAAEADGASLDALYDRVPEPLRGYVELVYDMRDRASVRYFERLLYKSPYYDVRSQSVCLSLVNPDSRRFRLSTPRLLDDGEMLLEVPFASEKLDAIYATRREARPFDEIADIFGAAGADRDTLRRFFTTEAPRSREPFSGEGVRLRYFGHACVLIETRDVSILIDPMVSCDAGEGPERFSHADLPEKIDYVVLSHNHQDHVLFETLLELRRRIGQILVPRSRGDTRIDPSLKLLLENVGFPRVRELREMESVAVPGGSITALPFFGEHADLDIRTKMGISVSLGGRSVLLVVDSNNFEPRLYEHVHAKTGNADVLFVGMECEGAPMSWLYGPLFTRPLTRKHDDARRFDGSDCDKAMNLVDRFGPSRVYIYAMGMEPWLGHVAAIHYTEASRPIIESDRTVKECAARGIEGERLSMKKEVYL